LTIYVICDIIQLFLNTSEVNMSETRSERFKRLANHRTNTVLDKLRLLGNLSNKSNYEYTEEDLRKIFLAVESQLKTVKTKFQFPKINKFRL
jgi:hypothetical protein